MTSTSAGSLLATENLVRHFTIGGGLGRAHRTVRAVDGVTFAIEPGGTFALVGESGCGKTTVAKMVLRLDTPTAGAITFEGRDLGRLSRADVKAYRRQVQAVFQDPYSSLNPRLRVFTILAEPIRAHRLLRGAALERRIVELLDVVGLPPTAARLYPHEFSGGQRQRIAIARALALGPKFLVLDEPVSALDVSIRAQIVNLLTDIQDALGLTFLVIAHDLALVEHWSTTVGVMYLGNLVEIGPTDEVFQRPQHPYTRALLGAVPRPDPNHRIAADLVAGEIGSALDPPSGCRFHPRCPHVMPVCRTDRPALDAVGPSHRAACHLLSA